MIVCLSTLSEEWMGVIWNNKDSINWDEPGEDNKGQAWNRRRNDMVAMLGVDAKATGELWYYFAPQLYDPSLIP